MPPATAPTPEEVARPGASRRVVRVFDFEERDTNPHEVPEHWFHAHDRPKAPRPGFPAWNLATLRYTSEGGLAAAGEGAVQLPTAGGSTSLLLGDGVIPVFQNADYLISAKVRTENLTHARAALVARFLDAAGRTIPNTEVRTELVVSNGEWKPVATELVGDAANAAYIQLELQLLQPQQHHAARADAGTVWPQDFDGSAWFDDVAIVQLPRIEITTASPTNITAQPGAPELKLLVRDLTGEPLAIRIIVTDAEGRPADSLNKSIGAGFTQLDWTPRLPRLGWYRAAMTVTTDSGTPVGQSFVDFLWTASSVVTTDAVLVADRARFGLSFSEIPAQALPHAATFVRQIGAGALSIPVWNEQLTTETAPAHTGALAPLIDALLADRRVITLTLPRLPAQLAALTQLDPADTWTLLAGQQRAWLPYLAPTLERYGQRINRWQLGAPGDDRVLSREHASAEAQSISQALAMLVPGPTIAVPTSVGAGWPSGSSPPALVKAVPADAPPPVVTAAVRSAAPLLESGDGELSFVLQPTSAHAAGATLTARHAVHFWAALSRADGAMIPGATMSLQDPWVWVQQGRRSQLAPRPEAGVWRTMTDQLAGRRVVGSVPAGDGVTCFILAPAPGLRQARPGALVAWSESSQPATLTGDFGRGQLRTIDLYGNSLPVPASGVTSAEGRPRTSIPLSEAPIFIEGVDVDLIRFTGALAINPPTLESSTDQHERELVILNPWPAAVSGQVTFLEPGGFDTGHKNRSWQISPRTVPFNIAPGDTARLPIAISFSPAEEVGPKDFVMAVQLSGDQQAYGTIEVRRAVEVSVQNLTIDLTAKVQGGDDLVIEATLTNRGPTAVTLQLTAFAESLPRSKATITELPPGTQTTRRFTYPNAATKLRAQRILVSAEAPGASVRVNKSVIAP